MPRRGANRPGHGRTRKRSDDADSSKDSTHPLERRAPGGDHVSREQRIAETIAAYLAARGDRLASDIGMLRVRSVAGVLVVELDGAAYEVTISVRRR